MATKMCRLCDEEKPDCQFNKGCRVCRTCQNEQARLRAHGGRPCDVHLVNTKGDCANVGTEPFSAACVCGHEIDGMACRSCLRAVSLGCFTCWQGEKPHKCPVTFAEAAVAVSA